MKKIILLLLISNISFAGNYMSLSDIGKKNLGEHGTTVYMRKGKCQQMRNEECLDISGINVRYNKVENIEVDDKSKPILVKDNVVPDLADLDSCYEEISDSIQPVNPTWCQQVIDTGSDENGNTVCEMNILPYCYQYGGRQAICRDQGDGKYEAYCPVHTGAYDKMTINTLVENAALKALYIAEQATKTALKSQLKTAKTGLSNSLQNWSTLTEAQKNMVLKRLVRLQVGE